MITIEKWAGLITAASPYALPGGACVVQQNIQCLKPGQLTVRAGYTAVTTPGSPITSMVRYVASTQDKIFAVIGDRLAIITP